MNLKFPLLEAFLRWWLAQLKQLLPRGLRRSERRLFVTPLQEGLRFWRLEEGKEETVAEVAPEQLPSWREALPPSMRSWPVVLVLPAEKCLLTRISLPEAAAENLQQVIAFELDQYTPWTEEQACFDFQVRERRGDRIEVALAAISREELSRTLELLEAIDLRPVRADVASGGPLGFNLLPEERREASLSLSGRIAAAGLLLLLGAALLMPIVAQKRLEEALKRQIADLMPRADRVVALQQRVEKRRALLSKVAKKLSAQPPLLLVLEDLSARMPDHTHLIRLRYDRPDRRLYLNGLSGRAAELVSLLEASPYLEEVRFTAAITRDPRSGRERFQLQARVVPGEGKGR